MEKFLENIQKARAVIHTADHLFYMTYPLVQDKKLLLKIVLETKNAIAYCINSILQYEYIYKRIRLHQNPRSNFKTFQEKCSKRYSITPEEIALTIELFEIVEQHKKSPMEFTRGEKIVILSENMTHKTINPDKTKQYLLLAKSLIKKVESQFLRKI